MKKALLLALFISFTAQANEKLEFQVKELGLEVEDLKKALNEVSIKTDNQFLKLEEEISNLQKDLKNLKEKKETKPVGEQEPQKIVVVPVANVRAKPDLKSPVIAKAYKGMEVKVLDETRYFYRVEIGNIKGYIYKTLLTSPHLTP